MSLTDDLRQAQEQVPAIGLALVHEALTDPDVTVLAASALLMETRFKGLGKALLAYFTMRQLGHFVLVLASKADRLSQVITDGRE